MSGPAGMSGPAVGAVAAGGVLGALARWAVLPGLGGTGWAVLVVNVLGCLLIGAVGELVPAGTRWRLFLGTGVLGGFTTFSTYAVDGLDLLAAGRATVAVGYLAGTPLLALAAAGLGAALTRRVRR